MHKRIFFVLIAILTMGNQCAEIDVTDPDLANTMTELNSEWQKGYGLAVAEIGTRHFNVDRSTAFAAMNKTMDSLGFNIVMTEGDYYQSVSIPAASMFTDMEWQRIRQFEEPQMRRIATEHLGVKGNFARLEPEGLLIDGKITFIGTGEVTDISLTFRLVEIELQPPESILPRRDYPPPHAARVGFEKIWRTFEHSALPVTRLAESN